MRYTPQNTSAIGKYVDIFLDGEKLDRVAEADDEEGYVIVCLLDQDGHMFLDSDGEVATERRAGTVVVVPQAD